MTPPKPLTPWQAGDLPDALPRHIRRNIGPSESGCWLWLRSRSTDGYGWASLNNKTHQAHRLVYALLRGEPAAGLVLDHLCRVRHCVNPDHLEPVTPRENLRRGETPTGATTCDEGHPLSPYRGQRRCLLCLARYRRIAARQRRARLKEAS